VGEVKMYIVTVKQCAKSVNQQNVYRKLSHCEAELW